MKRMFFSVYEFIKVVIFSAEQGRGGERNSVCHEETPSSESLSKGTAI